MANAEFWVQTECPGTCGSDGRASLDRVKRAAHPILKQVSAPPHSGFLHSGKPQPKSIRFSTGCVTRTALAAKPTCVCNVLGWIKGEPHNVLIQKLCGFTPPSYKQNFRACLLWPSGCFCSIKEGHSTIPPCCFQTAVSTSFPQSGANSQKVELSPWGRFRNNDVKHTPKKFWVFWILNCWNLPQGCKRELSSSSEMLMRHEHTNSGPCTLLSFPQPSSWPALIAQSTRSSQALCSPSELIYSSCPCSWSSGQLGVIMMPKIWELAGR